MITIESQLHGYRQGHELLSATVMLPKNDQIILDRLSDISGPLRAGETFTSYVSGYPLPNGAFYVLARTWQDLTVQRAGCVRTLSLLIPIELWSNSASLAVFYDHLSSLSELPNCAEQINIGEISNRSLPPIEGFQGNELLEALFLEELNPVAVMDAENPELIAQRIVTALWPSVRKIFAFSTFALSPRRIEGKDFDLIFVPKSARSKFADWPGRRIDGRAKNDSRHRWTNSLMVRVFNEPIPKLLSNTEIEAIGVNELDARATLRIVLLWNELMSKLVNSPFALLGLLDIAISRRKFTSSAFSPLKELLNNAVDRVIQNLPEDEAWQFIYSVSLKIIDTPLFAEWKSIASAISALTEKFPKGAITFLNQRNSNSSIINFLPAITKGIGNKFNLKTEHALLSALPSTLIQLLEAGGVWVGLATKTPSLVQYIGEILSLSSFENIEKVKKILLPYLVDNSQMKIAKPIFMAFEVEELLDEVSFLSENNKFSADEFIHVLTERAIELNIISTLRGRLLLLEESPGRKHFIFSTLSADVEDFKWILHESGLDSLMVKDFIIQLFRAATSSQLTEVLNNESLCVNILNAINEDANDVILKIFNEGKLPIDSFINTAIWLLRNSAQDERVNIAFKGLNRALSEKFKEDESGKLFTLFEGVGDRLNGGWAVQEGLNGHLGKEIINRNFIAFNAAPPAAREPIIDAVDYLASSISYRYELDISEEAAYALTNILFDARRKYAGSVIVAAGNLLPLLFRSTKYPVSKVIVATFPIVYQELAENDSVQDVLKFIPFLDWDKCKAARVELVNAFLRSSEWPPEDLLITACLCNDEKRIIKQVWKSNNGSSYVESIGQNLSRVPEELKQRALHAISEIYNLNF